MVRSNRAGFTLVELLVVIAIIAVLSGLLLVGVQTARQAADVYKVTSDFNQLNTAISGFKAKFNRYPPCEGGGPMGTFRLCSEYPSPATDNWPEVVVLKAIFGRMDRRDNGLRLAGAPVPATTPILLDPNQSLIFFLTGGSYNEYLGFNSSPSQPFAPPSSATGQRLQGTPFMDISKSKDRLMAPTEWFNFRQRWDAVNRLPAPPTPAMDAAGTIRYRWVGTGPQADTITTVSNEPWYLDPWGTPYLYLATSGIGSGGDYPLDTSVTPPEPRPILIGPWGGVVSGYNRAIALPNFPAVGVRAFKESPNKFVNHSGFQIISAGPNGSAIRNDIPWGFGYLDPNPPPPQIPFVPNYGTADFGKGNTGGGDDYVNFRSKALGEID